MNEPENFLSRWSRRKQEVEREEESAKPEVVVETQDGEQDSAGENSPRESKQKEPSDPAAKEPAFDLSKLPSIESITGETDIRPFLAAGVPASLRQAALRRLWAVDPHVRGIVELAENTWDFNAPGVPGFDLSAPTGDVRRMVAEMFGKKPDQADSPPHVREKSATPRDVHHNVSESPAREEEREKVAPPKTDEEPRSVRRTELAERRDEDVAVQSGSESKDDENVAVRRTHGGALPK